MADIARHHSVACETEAGWLPLSHLFPTTSGSYVSGPYGMHARSADEVGLKKAQGLNP